MKESSEAGPDRRPAEPFAAKLIGSQAFFGLFREGMGLVEETANYLDGDGRREARTLGRTASLAYATESMRLTTRLMQLASWLLVQRAVNQGEMTAGQALEEKRKLRLAPVGAAVSRETYADLPERLCRLIERASRLQERIERIESQLRSTGFEKRDNPVERQLARLRSAFGGGE
jgi:regulator of CtrA degradation